MQTAPVSAGSVSTLMAFKRALSNISGLVILSKNLATGLNASLVVIFKLVSTSNCCKTGSGLLVANVSPGKSRSGILLTVAVAAAVTMFAAPGPILDTQGIIFLRLFCFAYAIAACAIPCSFFP